jgi:ribonucleotide reductase beta subunit family protein with ferritin-like domain
MSETAATGTLDGIVAAGERFDMPAVAKTYRQIIKDEAFHLGLGRLLIERYVESSADADEVMRAIREMAEIVGKGSHTDVLVTPTA